jgi:alkanesulfonate monooxygenase SsuD/methylene tetrahydromethanopterin reductase-like flavin-dependent oxidoreductase (luciferase family)
VGSADDVGEQIEWYRDLLGVENLMLFPMMPGDSYASGTEQLHRLAEDVLPKFE